MSAKPALAEPREETGFHAPPPRATKARRIATDAEAIARAKEAASRIAEGAAKRDRERGLPYDELDLLSDAGLLAITVPKAYGGAEVRARTLAEVIAILAAADGSIGQIPQNHYLLEAIRLQGSEEQKRPFYERILDGERIGNALNQAQRLRRSCHVSSAKAASSRYVVGFIRRAFCLPIGSPLLATTRGRSTALVPRDAPGVYHRRLVGVRAAYQGQAARVFTSRSIPSLSSTSGPALISRRPWGRAQIMHAAIDQGTHARFAETIRFVRQSPGRGGTVASIMPGRIRTSLPRLVRSKRGSTRATHSSCGRVHLSMPRRPIRPRKRWRQRR